MSRLLFQGTPLHNDLLASPLSVLDLGARGGIHEDFHKLSPYFRAVLVEPDAAEAQALKNRVRDLGYACQIVDKAFWHEEGSIHLNLTSRPNNSSVFQPNDSFMCRYNVVGMDIERSVEVPCTTIDAWAKGNQPDQPFAEIMKMDVQGAELNVLQGAEATLKAHTVAVLCEVQFVQLYHDAPMFHEICQWMSERSFGCYGLFNRQDRATDRADKTRLMGRERLIQADALFLFDPFDDGADTSDRKWQALLGAAIAFELWDLALEIVEKNFSADAPILSAAIHRLGVQRTQKVREQIAQLPFLRAMDMNRDIHTFWNIRDNDQLF